MTCSSSLETGPNRSSIRPARELDQSRTSRRALPLARNERSRMQMSESPLEAETPPREASRERGTDTPALDPPDAVPTVEATAIRAMVDAAPDGVLMADENGRILFANRQLEELFGFDHCALLGRSVDDLLPEHSRQVHRA